MESYFLPTNDNFEQNNCNADYTKSQRFTYKERIYVLRIRREFMTKKEKAQKMRKEGKSIQEIANHLDLKSQTVRTYLVGYDYRKESGIQDFKPGWNKNRDGCRKCIYRASKSSEKPKRPGCNYILIEERSRGCRVEDCDKFVKGSKATI